jgi:uncharacterized membrane protein (DUF485 family)
MIKKILADLKSEKLPKWFKVLNLSLLLPIILWPIILFSTIFFFDNPSNILIPIFLFFLVNAYPLYLFILAWLNTKLFTRQKLLGVLLPLTFLISIIIGGIYICLKMDKNSKRFLQEEIERKKSGDLGCGFFKKNNVIYINDTIFKGVDAQTFEVICYDWQKDKKFYYYLRKPVPEIDHATFEVLDIDDHYGKDKNHVFYKNKIIQGADPKTFHYDKDKYNWKDKNNCYYYGNKDKCNDFK